MFIVKRGNPSKGEKNMEKYNLELMNNTLERTVEVYYLSELEELIKDLGLLTQNDNDDYSIIVNEENDYGWDCVEEFTQKQLNELRIFVTGL
jgi:phage-related tail protein